MGVSSDCTELGHHRTTEGEHPDHPEGVVRRVAPQLQYPPPLGLLGVRLFTVARQGTGGGKPRPQVPAAAHRDGARLDRLTVELRWELSACWAPTEPNFEIYIDIR